MKHIIIFLVLVCIVFACDTSFTDNQHEYKEEEYETISLDAQSKLVIQGLNGNIIINGSSSEDDINLDIEKIVRSRISVSDARSHMPDITVSVEEKTHEIDVSVDHPSNTDINYTVNFEITIPLLVDLDIDLGNGNISIESTAKNISIDLGNGNTNAVVVLPDTCSLDIDTGNGNINLYIPESTNASINASVGNGSVISSGLTIQNQQYSSKNLTGIIGNGAGTIIIRAGNGNIQIEGS